MIWLDRRPQNTSKVNVVLGNTDNNLYESRNVVISHNAQNGTVTAADLTLFDLTNATDQKVLARHLVYDFTQTDDSQSCPVLELVAEPYFLIYHSSSGVVEKIYQQEVNANGTYDLKAKTASGTLYGGYYLDYAGKGSYDNQPHATPVSGFTAYNGGMGSWDPSKSFTATPKITLTNGLDEGGVATAMKPLLDKSDVEYPRTYFLKEVPVNFLKPYMHFVYNYHTGEIVSAFMITGTDDLNYQNIKLNAVNITTGNRVAWTSVYKVVNSITGITDKLTCNSLFSKKGLLAVWNPSTAFLALANNANFGYQPSFITPDGIEVSGKIYRTVNVGNKTTTGTFTQAGANGGVYFTDVTQ